MFVVLMSMEVLLKSKDVNLLKHRFSMGQKR